MQGKRSERVGESMREVIAELLLREVKDPRVQQVSITEVQLSNDLRHGRVFFSCLGDEAAHQRAAAGLTSAAGFVRREVSRRLQLRYTPDITFVFDPRLETAERLADLLKESEPREE